MKHFGCTFYVKFTSFEQPSSDSALNLLNFSNFIPLYVIFLFYLEYVLLLAAHAFAFVFDIPLF